MTLTLHQYYVLGVCLFFFLAGMIAAIYIQFVVKKRPLYIPNQADTMIIGLGVLFAVVSLAAFIYFIIKFMKGTQ